MDDLKSGWGWKTIAPELPVTVLRNRCSPADLGFVSTEELTPAAKPLGQQRAMQALLFGVGIRAKGFNIYVSGGAGTGKTTAVRSVLEQAATTRSAPDDWCYVYSRDNPSRPRALRLAPGEGRRLRDQLRALVAEARRKIPSAFESDEYVSQREAILAEFNRSRDSGMQELATHAERGGFILQPGPTGLSLIPTMGNRPLSEEDIAGLRPEMREVIERTRVDLEARVQAFVRAMTVGERATRERLEAQDREVALHAVSDVMDMLMQAYAEQPAVHQYLEDVREEILGDIALFRSHPLPADGSQPLPADETSPEHALHARALRKYEVNLLGDHGDSRGAPIVFEPNPILPNLVGRVEREALLGMLVTDLTLISAGALHRANGGYLVLRLADLARSPLSWESLKRCLREETIAIEDMSEAFGMPGARGLQPEPIPLDVKVVLIGEPSQFGLLIALDPEFADHFKVRADFDMDVERNPESEKAYAAFLGELASRGGRALEAPAVALLIEESSRIAADQRKLSARLQVISDLVCESAFWAASGGRSKVSEQDVRKALDARRQRGAQTADRFREMIQRGILLVRPAGTAIGQIYGLAVIEAGDATFGHPSRITATISPGREGVVDIERVVELGGPIHSKGVLILTGYLAENYAQDKPLAFSARLVFEQSYQGIEGDSASLAELVALLSRIADLPVRQDLAVTGSVNQRGEVQAVGGVNEKVEGFFDVCADLGLTGTQGVLIPESNVSSLMLREDILAAVEQNRFHVYAVATVDEAVALMTGLEAGQRQSDGTWPGGTVHARVEGRLAALAEILRKFSAYEPDGAHPARAGHH
jgi:predicted ATP-dependent protease